MKEAKSVQFKIGAKKFQFIATENQEVIDNVLHIILEVNDFIDKNNKGMFSTENFAYFIFILATNLARIRAQDKQDNRTITKEDEQEVEIRIREIMQKISFLSASIEV